MSGLTSSQHVRVGPDTVVVNARLFTQPTTGVQRFTQEIVTALARIRDDVVVAIPDRPIEVELPEAIPVLRIGRLTDHLWEQWELPRYLRRHGNPLLVSLGNTAPVRYRPKISTQHDITYLTFPESYSTVFRAGYRLIAPRMVRSSDELITVSEYSRQALAARFGVDPERYTVIGNAADAMFAPPERPAGGRQRYVFAVSTLSPHKNIARLLDAFAVVARDHPDVVLRVAGGVGPGMIATSRLDAADSERVELLGRVSDEQLVELYQGAECFVFPSLSEGFGIPPIEAQSCGCPVVAARATSLPEVLGDSAVYFDPLDPEDMASAIGSVLTDSARRESLREAGLRNASRFSWDRSARSLSEAIDRVIRRTTGRQPT